MSVERPVPPSVMHQSVQDSSADCQICKAKSSMEPAGGVPGHADLSWAVPSYVASSSPLQPSNCLRSVPTGRKDGGPPFRQPCTVWVTPPAGISGSAPFPAGMKPVPSNVSSPSMKSPGACYARSTVAASSSLGDAIPTKSASCAPSHGGINVPHMWGAGLPTSPVATQMVHQFPAANGEEVPVPSLGSDEPVRTTPVAAVPTSGGLATLQNVQTRLDTP